MGKRGFCVIVSLVLGVGVGILLVIALPAVAASLPVADGVIERDGGRAHASVLPEIDSAVASGAGELYVSPTGTDAGDCTSPYSACLTVQYAVDSALEGCVIKVASGVYTHVHARLRRDVQITGLVTQVVYISKTLTLQGGYTITNWAVADPETNPTVLDAQGRGRVVYITGDISPTVEGFVLRGGDAYRLGGHRVSPSTFDGGGGVYVITAAVTLRNNRVLSNTAGAGAGVYLNTSDSWLSDNTVALNVGGDGGGLYLRDSAVTVSGNTVVANVATVNGGGLYLEGSPTMLAGNTIVSNTAQSRSGGGLYLERSDATLRGNYVFSNIGSAGGGMYLEESQVELGRNTFIGNEANRGGGAYVGLFGDVTLANDIFAENRASLEGGGLYVVAASARLRHATIACNSAYGDSGDGSGIYVGGIPYYDSFGDVSLTNTILLSHTVGITVGNGCTATLEATLWGAGNWANSADWGGAGRISTGTLNLHADPAFVEPDIGDYHIRLSSAAVDQGVPSSVDDDIDGHPRPLGEGYDIGADETGLIVAKRADRQFALPGARLTYVISVANTTDVPLVAAVTDTLPVSVTLDETSGSTLFLPGGGVGVTWTAQITPFGGVWTQTVVVRVADETTGPLTNVVRVTTDHGATGMASVVSAVGVPVYLPLVIRRWPPIPHQPVLDPIEDPDGDGTYVVSWTEVPARLAITYTLQEAADLAFTVAVSDVCSTVELSCPVSGNLPGSYYYRVRGHNAWGDGPWSAVEAATVAYACPATSTNQYGAGIAYQSDLDNPVRPATDHADKNLALRGYTVNADPGLKRELVDYGSDDPTQPPQLATLFDPYRVPALSSFYRVHDWNWAPSPEPGTRAGPITTWPVTALGMETTPGETLHVPDSGYDIGGGVEVIVLFADEDTVALRYAREDSSAPSGYTVHIDNICTDPNLLTLYNSLDDPGGARYTYVPPGERPYGYALPALAAGHPLGTARTTETVVAIVDTGAFMDTRSCNEWWYVRPGYTGLCPPP
jgi:uncharacterized repeat protein (TIGR01451 family)